MRNMDNFKPTRRTLDVRDARDVFAPAKPEDADPWLNTSVRLRTSTRNRVKLYAAKHGLKMQDVIEDALTAYLGEKGA